MSSKTETIPDCDLPQDPSSTTGQNEPMRAQSENTQTDAAGQQVFRLQPAQDLAFGAAERAGRAVLRQRVKITQDAAIEAFAKSGLFTAAAFLISFAGNTELIRLFEKKHGIDKEVSLKEPSEEEPPKKLPEKELLAVPVEESLEEELLERTEKEINATPLEEPPGKPSEKATEEELPEKPPERATEEKPSEKELSAVVVEEPPEKESLEKKLSPKLLKFYKEITELQNICLLLIGGVERVERINEIILPKIIKMAGTARIVDAAQTGYIIVGGRLTVKATSPNENSLVVPQISARWYVESAICAGALLIARTAQIAGAELLAGLARIMGSQRLQEAQQLIPPVLFAEVLQRVGNKLIADIVEQIRTDAVLCEAAAAAAAALEVVLTGRSRSRKSAHPERCAAPILQLSQTSGLFAGTQLKTNLDKPTAELNEQSATSGKRKKRIADVIARISLPESARTAQLGHPDCHVLPHNAALSQAAAPGAREVSPPKRSKKTARVAARKAQLNQPSGSFGGTQFQATGPIFAARPIEQSIIPTYGFQTVQAQTMRQAIHPMPILQPSLVRSAVPTGLPMQLNYQASQLGLYQGQAIPQLGCLNPYLFPLGSMPSLGTYTNPTPSSNFADSQAQFSGKEMSSDNPPPSTSHNPGPNA